MCAFDNNNGGVSYYNEPDLHRSLAAFHAPSGTVGRNTLIAPGLNNFDFSLTKKTRVGETVTVEFRTEFYNLFNRPHPAPVFWFG